ncbi:5'-nucleotidase C-terminal domain-containing protein [Thalassobellus suaedae]|uniref:5'-nucleotidase n=1 Tax=Thalassobellus suaedae TaxID=3074124 RepID=A0ABY9XV84_9FLAO|nr:5'-nucleotidase [Flavobacteriaceae bacterium HL-DH14]
MRFTHLFFLLNILFFFSCKQEPFHLKTIEGKQIPVTDSLSLNSEIEDFIKPYREHVQKKLDSVLAYSKEDYSKTDSEFNTAIGNFIVDAIFNEANPIFKMRTGHNIDMVILNYGSIRSSISKGNITFKTAYRLMPFENSIVVVALKGSQIKNLVSYLIKSKEAHPISKLKLSIDENFNLIDYTINGRKVETDKVYYVASNDYLYNGGDDMTFFKPNDSLYILNYKVRNALIDNFIKIDTLKTIRDDRFIQITN